jgi:signal transduction histidine kinase
MPPAITPVREPTRETLAPLLLRRFRLFQPSILIGTAAFAALHVVLGEPNLGWLLFFKLVQALVAAGGLWISSRHPSRRVIIGSLLALVITLNAVTSITGMIIGNVHTNALLFVATTLATSSFLPWGPRVQAVSSCAAFAAAIAPLFGESMVYHDFWYDLAALAIAFAISIYIASEVEKDTLAEYRAQTATEALAESRADFEGVFRSSNVLLAIIELGKDDFVYVEVNDKLAQMFETTPEQMRGVTGRGLGFSDAQIAQWLAFFGRCAERGSSSVPDYRLDLLSPPRWFHVNFSAIHDRPAGPLRFSGVAVDVTDLRHATDDIRRLNLDLEAQVRDRTALLEAANKDLESFAYSVSHDLRTPLRTIEGFAALIREDRESSLSEVASRQLERIGVASRHMAQLIDDMLMLSRASRAEIRREPVDVTNLARAVANELYASRNGRDVTIEVEAGLTANADPQLMRIVLANLVGNAWKYTARREVAHIEVASEIYEGEDVFVVRDNGCGFDMRFVGKLFQPFQRLHAADEFEGTGVGLATVARIVRRHGGKVWAEGVTGRGATFRFTVGDGGFVNAS